MNKKCRILLYVLSIVMVAGCITAVARTKGSTPEVKVPGEEPAAVVSGEDTEHAGADSGADRAPAREENETAVETTEAEERTEAAEVAEEAEAGGQAEADGSTTILFTGDVLFANAFKAGYDADGIKGVVAPELLEELRAADILMVNNEFPFSDRGTPMADKQFTFRCSPGYVKALNEMGVDVVSLANNHTLDYGREALSDTFAALDGAGILYGGAGVIAPSDLALLVLKRIFHCNLLCFHSSFSYLESITYRLFPEYIQYTMIFLHFTGAGFFHSFL